MSTASEMPPVEQPTTLEGTQPILPVWFVPDVSGSMTREVGAVDTIIDELRQALRADPEVGDMCHLGVVTFADTAQEVLRPARVADPAVVVPALHAGGLTNLAAGLDLTRAAISRELPGLRDRHKSVYRPLMIILTDGYPNLGDWKVSHAQLTSPEFAYRPNIVAFGFGKADEAVIRGLATAMVGGVDGGQRPAAYFAGDVSAGEVFDEIRRVIVHTIVTAVYSTPGSAFAAPPAPSGGSGLLELL